MLQSKPMRPLCIIKIPARLICATPNCFSALAEACRFVRLKGMTLEDLKRDCHVEGKSIPEIEAENLYEDDGRVPHLPFGFMNGQWLELKNRMQAGDQLYYYVSSPESWSSLAGREGYVLVSGGGIIGDVLTTFN